MYEYELESEFEGEFEWESEFENEWEGEYETELEGEYESEEFLRAVRGLAGRAANWGRRQMAPGSGLRRVAFGAARQAVRQGLPALGRWAGGQIGQRGGGAIGGLFGPEGVPVGQAIGRGAGQAAGQAAGNWAVPRVLNWIPEREEELEWEFEGEFEGEINPLRRVYADALMEHMGHAATEAETEAEAEAFIGALIPMVARAVPAAASTVMRAAPGLVRGLAGATRALRSNPATRPLVRALPTVVRRTAMNIARQATQGRRVTPRGAVQTLARQTARVIGSPTQCVQAFRRSRALDRQYHRAAGPTPATTAARQRRIGA